MAFYGIIDSYTVQRFTPNIIRLHSFFTKEREGKLCKNYQHLDSIQEGEVIARYEDGEEIHSPLHGYLIMPNHDAKIGTERFYLGE